MKARDVRRESVALTFARSAGRDPVAEVQALAAFNYAAKQCARALWQSVPRHLYFRACRTVQKVSDFSYRDGMRSGIKVISIDRVCQPPQAAHAP